MSATRKRLRRFLAGEFDCFLPHYEAELMALRRIEPCVYCGEPANPRHTLDHLVPKSQGGFRTHENTVSACEICNVDRDKKRTLFYLVQLHRRKVVGYRKKQLARRARKTQRRKEALEREQARILKQRAIVLRPDVDTANSAPFYGTG